MASDPPNAPPPSRIVVASAGDRERAARQARRHTFVVRALRFVLPVCAVGLLASYGVFVKRTIEVDGKDHKGVFSAGPIVPSFENLTMRNPKYDGFNLKDGSSYSIRADKAVTDLSPQKPIALVGISGTVRQADGTVIKIEAAEGRFQRKTEELELYNGIRVETSSGLHARLTRALVLPKEGLLTSSEPVELWMKTGQVRGNTMVLRQKERIVVFDRGVAIRLTPTERKPSGAAAPKAKAPALIDLAGSNNEPVDVSAVKMTVRDEKQTIHLEGGVRAKQGQGTLEAVELEIAYERATRAGRTDAKSAAAGGADGAGLFGGSGAIRSARAKGDVVITRDGTRVISRVVDFLATENRIVLTGDVVMTSGKDRKVLADRAEFNTVTNDVVLTGQRVTLTQGQNVLRGARVVVVRARGSMRVTRPGGRIAAHLVPPNRGKPAGSGPNQEPASKGAAARGLAGIAGGLTFKTDSNAPLDVDAVSLMVDDARRTATFAGKVVARQGAIKIEALRLIAHYIGQSGLLPVTGREQGRQTAKAGATRLSRIRVEGGVVIASQEGQTARGDWADFDVARNTVTLGGNVRLQQGRQVITGPKIVIDLNTGISRVIRPEGTAAAERRSPAGRRASVKGSQPPSCGAGRTCLVFFPQDAQNSRKQPARPSVKPVVPEPPRAPATIGRGWSATAVPRSGPPSN